MRTQDGERDMTKIKSDPEQRSRRDALSIIAAAALAGIAGSGRILAASLPGVTVTKDPNCGCCTGWIEHLRQAGFPVRIIETSDLQPVKARLGVPTSLASCHTAEVAGYVVEGHVPASAVTRLLREKPKAIGLALAGMPVGSPGMEGGPAETYDVVLFAPGREQTFERYRGLQRL
jgi:hypothetical protein